jgi:hypothetical protein
MPAQIALCQFRHAIEREYQEYGEKDVGGDRDRHIAGQPQTARKSHRTGSGKQEGAGGATAVS